MLKQNISNTVKNIDKEFHSLAAIKAANLSCWSCLWHGRGWCDQLLHVGWKIIKAMKLLVQYAKSSMIYDKTNPEFPRQIKVNG